MATIQHKIFCVREFIKTQSATAVQRAFRLRFNIQPPTRKSICLWNHQFEQIGCLCKGKTSGRPRVSEENVRRIQGSFERSPRKSTRRASRELGIPQPTLWRVLRRHLLFNWVSFLITLYYAPSIHNIHQTRCNKYCTVIFVLSWPEDGRSRPKHVAKYYLIVIIASCLDVCCVLTVHNILHILVSS